MLAEEEVSFLKVSLDDAAKKEAGALSAVEETAVISAAAVAEAKTGSSPGTGAGAGASEGESDGSSSGAVAGGVVAALLLCLLVAGLVSFRQTDSDANSNLYAEPSKELRSGAPMADAADFSEYDLASGYILVGLDADAKRQSAETANEATYDLASGSGLPALYEEPASVKKPKSKKPKKEKKEKKEIPTAEAETFYDVADGSSGGWRPAAILAVGPQ